MNPADPPRESVPTSATVAVAGGKGGCGKTTVALGLARALVERGERPLVVDADVDVPDLHIRADVDREPGLPAVGAGRRPAAASQPSDRFPGVSVLAAGVGTGNVGTALAAVADRDRPVILDCPAGAGPDATTPLRVADATVLVSTRTRPGRADAAKTARMARGLDAPPRIWMEHVAAGGDNPSAPPALQSLPRIDVPEVGWHPLERSEAVRAVRAGARALYGDTQTGSGGDTVVSGTTRP